MKGDASHVIQRSHFWGHMQKNRKQGLREILAHPPAVQHYSQ